MRGSIVEGKCSSSAAASLKLRRISSRETGSRAGLGEASRRASVDSVKPASGRPAGLPCWCNSGRYRSVLYIVSTSTLRGPSFGSGILHHRVPAILNRRHQAALALQTASNAIVPNVLAISLSMKSGSPRAQLVGQIADDGLFLASRLIFFAEALRDAHLLAMAERVRLRRIPAA